MATRVLGKYWGSQTSRPPQYKGLQETMVGEDFSLGVEDFSLGVEDFSLGVDACVQCMSAFEVCVTMIRLELALVGVLSHSHTRCVCRCF